MEVVDDQMVNAMAEASKDRYERVIRTGGTSDPRRTAVPPWHPTCHDSAALI